MYLLFLVSDVDCETKQFNFYVFLIDIIESQFIYNVSVSIFFCAYCY